MKICIVGLGSIGRKHLLNIQKVLNKRNESFVIDALRSSCKQIQSELKGIIRKEYFEINDLPDDYDIAFITNPTNMHYIMIQHLSKKAKHLFIEKPLFDKVNYDIAALKLTGNGIYYVACPLRHKEIIKCLKNIVEEEQIYSVRAICSSYLPDWRKNIDYRTVYSGKKAMGGGVALDLIHEWDYLTYLFGMPETVYGFKGGYSELEIDSDDLAVYIGKYPDKIIEVHLDYFGRVATRKLELYCKDYKIEVDLLKNRIQYDGEAYKQLIFEEEDFYLEEMSFFFDIIDGEKSNINSIEHAKKILELILIGE